MKKGIHNLSSRNVERALYHTLKDEGLLPPESKEDIADLEEELGEFPPPSGDAGVPLRLARKGVSEAVPQGATSGRRVERLLAEAARRGRKISPEVRAKMERDRKEAERENDSPSA